MGFGFESQIGTDGDDDADDDVMDVDAVVMFVMHRVPDQTRWN